MRRRTVTAATLAVAIPLVFGRSAAAEYTVHAPSLSHAAVNAAVWDVRTNAPAGHGTVYLPAGDAHWSNSPPVRALGGINLIGQGTNRTIIRWSHNNKLITYNDYDEQETDWDFSPMRISGISFRADASSRGTALNIRSIEGFRVDHCEFVTIKNSAYIIFVRSTFSYQPRPYGVFDHCRFKAHGSSTYGLYIGPCLWPNGNQDYLAFLGKKQNVFIEDCVFEDIGHHIALFGGGTAVFRHNHCSSWGTASIIDSHELSGTVNDEHGVPQYHGGRCMEVYGNTFTHPPGFEHATTVLRPRNGGGVFFNNTLVDPRYTYQFVHGRRTVETTAANGPWHVDELVDGDPATWTKIMDGDAYAGSPGDVPGSCRLNWSGSKAVEKVRIYNRSAGVAGSSSERTIKVCVGAAEVYSGLVGPAGAWLELDVGGVSGDHLTIETTSQFDVTFYEVEVHSGGAPIPITSTSGTHGKYPGYDQIHFWWIWSNEVQNVLFPGVRIAEGEPFGVLNIQEDRDYFLRAPDPSISHPTDALLPGFTEPDYTPYTYPHPLVSGSAADPVIPEERRVDWTPGIAGGIPDYPVGASVRDHGAAGDGTADDTAAFLAAIAAAPAGTAVLIPQGTYRLTDELIIDKGIVLRGEGAARSMLAFSVGGGDLIVLQGSASGAAIAVTGGLARGSTVLELADASGIAAGDVLEMEQDNDPAVFDPNAQELAYGSWQDNHTGQMLPVQSVAGNTVTLGRPLHYTYNPAMNPRVYRRTWVKRGGIEYLKISREPTDTWGNNVRLKYAHECWVRSVWSELGAKTHVVLDRSFAAEVRQSYFNDCTIDGDGGAGYGVSIGRHATDCLVEDNIFRQLRHSMIVQLGANANVFGYNYSREPDRSDVSPTRPAPDLCVHGSYGYMNLFEGNTVQFGQIDNVWGRNGPTTIFRNRFEKLLEPGDYSAYHLKIRENNPTHNLVGNELGTADPNSHASTPLVIESDHAGTQLVHGNYVYQDPTQQPQWDPALSNHTIAASYYRSSKPAFFGSKPWPIIGGDLAPTTEIIPAQERWLAGSPVPTPGNIAPVVDSGPAYAGAVTLPDTVGVAASAHDPDSGPQPLTYTWEKATGPGTVSFDPNGTTGSSSSTATFGAPGTYTLRVVVSDADKSTSATGPAIAVAPDPQAPVTVRFTIGDGLDDVSYWGASFNASGNSLYMGGQHLTGDDSRVALRFSGVTVPQGATVQAARLLLRSRSTGTHTNDADVAVSAEAADNAARITSHADYLARARTTSSVAWPIRTTWAWLTEKTSPDIASVVDQVVNRPGWQTGNSLQVFVDNAGSPAGAWREGAAWDYSSGNYAPQLEVTYVPGAPIARPAKPGGLKVER